MSAVQKVDALAVLDRQLQFTIASDYSGASDDHRDLVASRAAVAELMAAAEDARSALHSCIDALSSDEQSDHDALDRLTAALARAGASLIQTTKDTP